MFLATLFKFPQKLTKSVNCGSAEKMSLILYIFWKGGSIFSAVKISTKWPSFSLPLAKLVDYTELTEALRYLETSFDDRCWPSLLNLFSMILSTFARDFCSKGSCWSRLATSVQHWGFSFDDPLRGCLLLQGPWGIILQHLPLTGFQQNENHSHTDPSLYFVASCIQVHRCHTTVSHLCYPKNHIACNRYPKYPLFFKLCLI